jgi:thiosulfate dehydrogenase [quinone] large subunit
MTTLYRHHTAAADPVPTTRPTEIQGSSTFARRTLAVLRIGFGFTLLWAFFDKLLALGFQSFYNNVAGAAWADWLFMLGLLGIGTALILGIGMRAAAVAGALLYLLMWTVVLPPENNPVIDDHILGAITLVALAALNTGDTWGLGRRWTKTGIVQRYPALR